MESDEYIQLQNLLTKLRVILLNEISRPNLVNRIRNKNIRMLRNIDGLRKDVPLAIRTEECKEERCI